MDGKRLKKKKKESEDEDGEFDDLPALYKASSAVTGD